MELVASIQKYSLALITDGLSVHVTVQKGDHVLYSRAQGVICPVLGTVAGQNSRLALLWVNRKLTQGGHMQLMELMLLFFRIGRMAGRLPRELADDVVGSVLDCFRWVITLKGKPATFCSCVLYMLSIEIFIRTLKPNFSLS